jgi:hypothetical protein
MLKVLHQIDSCEPKYTGLIISIDMEKSEYKSNLVGHYWYRKCYNHTAIHLNGTLFATGRNIRWF